LKIKALFLITLSSFFISGCDSKNEFENAIVKDQIKIATYNLKSSTDENIQVKREKENFIFQGEKYKNKVVLLVFFATWCPPCKAEIPHLVNLQKLYKGKLEIVALNMGNKDGTTTRNININTFKEENSMNYTVTNEGDNYTLASAVGGVYTIPAMFLLDTTGKIVENYVGVVPEEMLGSDILKYIK
jgi:thiol-disulfide isomerase/thioredoxin